MLDEGLPGETVDAEITGDKGNYFTAAVKSVVNASSKRVIPRCGHYRTCSSYQYIDYPEQSAIKEGEIKEMFSHQFRSGLPEIHFRQALSSWGYRNKVHLHVISDNGSFHYAYHTPGRTNSYEKVDTCFLLSETMSGILVRLLSVIREQTAGFCRRSRIERKFLRKNRTFGYIRGYSFSGTVQTVC
jgi:23S rRNA (uracil1939-C5)-methyltransferase